MSSPPPLTRQDSQTSVATQLWTEEMQQEEDRLNLEREHLRDEWYHQRCVQVVPRSAGSLPAPIPFARLPTEVPNAQPRVRTLPEESSADQQVPSSS